MYCIKLTRIITVTFKVQSFNLRKCIYILYVFGEFYWRLCKVAPGRRSDFPTA